VTQRRPHLNPFRVISHLCNDPVAMRAQVSLFVVTLAVTGCSQDATGHWCGRQVASDAECTGDETGLLLLNHEGETLGGQACEAHEHDCHVLEKGRVVSDRIAFHYSFRDGYVDAKLAIDGDVMIGSFWASKCKCDISRTFYRIR
jgi:hypothetical protein